MLSQFCVSSFIQLSVIWLTFGHRVFTIITEIPPVYFLYDSPRLSVAFLLFIFAVSVWNGGRFYVEVFGRKFEKGEQLFTSFDWENVIDIHDQSSKLCVKS